MDHETKFVSRVIFKFRSFITDSIHDDKIKHHDGFSECDISRGGRLGELTLLFVIAFCIYV